MEPKTVYTPPPPRREPRPPRFWHKWGKPIGMIVEHDGVNWILLESWSWMDYEGVHWYRYRYEVPPTQEFIRGDQLEQRAIEEWHKTPDGQAFLKDWEEAD